MTEKATTAVHPRMLRNDMRLNLQSAWEKVVLRPTTSVQ